MQRSIATIAAVEKQIGGLMQQYCLSDESEWKGVVSSATGVLPPEAQVVQRQAAGTANCGVTAPLQPLKVSSRAW